MKRLLPIFLLSAALALAAGCSCGGDDDDDHDEIDDTGADDDTAGDDSQSDDSGDDTQADDTGDDTQIDDTADDDTAEVCDFDAHDPLIEQGKTLLGRGDPNGSYDAFADALDLCPESGDAKMGMLIADAMWYGQWLKIWLDFAGNSFWQSRSPGEKGMAYILQSVLRDSFLPVNAEMFRLADDIKENHPDVRFYVEPLPMWVDGDHVVLDMSGEWDAADAQDVRAFANIWEFIERVLLSMDLQFDYATLTDLSPPPGMTIIETIHFYSGFILDTLADPDYPDFLTLLPGGDVELMDAGVAGGHMCRDLVAGMNAMLLETDPQQDDVAGYIDRNGNGRWDEGEPYKVPYFGDLNDGQNDFWLDLLHMLDELGIAFLDEGPEDPYPLWPNWFNLSNLNFILTYMDLIQPGLEFPPIPVPIGTWFYHPTSDGLRGVAGQIAQFLFDYTAP